MSNGSSTCWSADSSLQCSTTIRIKHQSLSGNTHTHTHRQRRTHSWMSRYFETCADARAITNRPGSKQLGSVVVGSGGKATSTTALRGFFCPPETGGWLVVIKTARAPHAHRTRCLRSAREMISMGACVAPCAV